LKNLVLSNFEHEVFGEIRITDIEGTLWFVANDVARALGYEKPNNAINLHCRNINKFNYPATGRELNIIPASDVYRLIMRSELPEAGKFQDWVTDEVLPSVHKNGFYGTDSFVDMALNNTDNLIAILQKYKFDKQQRQLMEQQRDEAVKTK